MFFVVGWFCVVDMLFVHMLFVVGLIVLIMFTAD